VATHPLIVSRARTSRRILLDRLATRFVVLGGIVIIASILAILFVIAAEVSPLFKKPAAARLGAARAVGPAPAPGGSLGVDEYREIAYQIGQSGTLEFLALKEARALPAVQVPDLDGARVTAVASLGNGRHVLGTSDGRAIPLEMTFDVAFKDGTRTVTPEPRFGQASAVAGEEKRALLRLATASTDSGPVTVAQVGATELLLQTVVEKKALIGPGRKEEAIQALAVQMDGESTALLLDGR
jgi:ABC-type uncharacterized transport system permease subunit